MKRIWLSSNSCYLVEKLSRVVLKRRDHVVDLGVNGRIILGWILGK
jgi:hypothetical protein